MQTDELKTDYAKQKEARDKAVYDLYTSLLAQPGAMKTKVTEKVMKEFDIHASSTVWATVKRVEKNLSISK